MTTQNFVNNRYARANEYDIAASKLKTREARSIPNVPEDLKYDEVVILDLALIFADIRGYTEIIADMDPKVAARMMSLYVTEMGAAIRHHGGTIVSIEGDGIIGAFASTDKRNAQTISVRSAITMNTSLDYVVNKKLRSFQQNPISCGYGIDFGKIFITRAGIRGEGKNELVFIGSAMTRSAKYQSIAKSNELFVSSRVYNSLEEHYKKSEKGWRWYTISTKYGTLYKKDVNHWSGINKPQ